MHQSLIEVLYCVAAGLFVVGTVLGYYGHEWRIRSIKRELDELKSRSH